MSKPPRCPCCARTFEDVFDAPQILVRAASLGQPSTRVAELPEMRRYLRRLLALAGDVVPPRRLRPPWDREDRGVAIPGSERIATDDARAQCFAGQPPFARGILMSSYQRCDAWSIAVATAWGPTNWADVTVWLAVTETSGRPRLAVQIEQLARLTVELPLVEAHARAGPRVKRP